MPVVSNTSPLWNLASIDRLDLLREQFPDIRIPPEVWQELLLGRSNPEIERLQKAISSQWISIQPVTQPTLMQTLMLELDCGESAAIALALELKTSRVLIDESDGRSTATALGLQPTGILGVLLRAKKERKIDSFTEEMIKLRHGAGFFIADTLYKRLRCEAGEAE